MALKCDLILNAINIVIKAVKMLRKGYLDIDTERCIEWYIDSKIRIQTNYIVFFMAYNSELFEVG